MKPIHYYSTFAFEYPNKGHYTVIYYYNRGKMVCVRKPFSPNEFIPEGCVEEKVFDEEGYQIHLDKHLEERLALEKEFEQDLIKAHGVENHVKARACFLLAWDYGISQGLGTVAEYFEELCNLIRENP